MQGWCGQPLAICCRPPAKRQRPVALQTQGGATPPPAERPCLHRPKNRAPIAHGVRQRVVRKGIPIKSIVYATPVLANAWGCGARGRHGVARPWPMPPAESLNRAPRQHLVHKEVPALMLGWRCRRHSNHDVGKATNLNKGGHSVSRGLGRTLWCPSGLSKCTADGVVPRRRSSQAPWRKGNGLPHKWALGDNQGYGRHSSTRNTLGGWLRMPGVQMHVGGAGRKEFMALHFDSHHRNHSPTTRQQPRRSQTTP